MDKCSPANMRKALIAADQFRKAGIEFVPIPVINLDNKLDMINLMLENLEIIEKQ